jgi:hypothetical protein
VSGAVRHLVPLHKGAYKGDRMDNTRFAQQVAKLIQEACPGQATTVAAMVMGFCYVPQGESYSEPVRLPPIQPPAQVVENKGSGGVMIHKGYECWCHSCNGVVYQINADIMAQGVGINQFLRSFTPTGHGTPLDRDHLNIFVDKGNNRMIDCPVCNGTSCLQITGKREAVVKESVEKNPLSDGSVSVGSVDGSSLGIV